jgi:hypothetical protein
MGSPSSSYRNPLGWTPNALAFAMRVCYLVTPGATLNDGCLRLTLGLLLQRWG